MSRQRKKIDTELRCPEVAKEITGWSDHINPGTLIPINSESRSPSSESAVMA